MDQAESRTVRIDSGEHDGRTRAVAHLQARDTDTLVGVGFARLNPADRTCLRSATRSRSPVHCPTSATGCCTPRPGTSSRSAASRRTWRCDDSGIRP